MQIVRHPSFLPGISMLATLMVTSGCGTVSAEMPTFPKAELIYSPSTDLANSAEAFDYYIRAGEVVQKELADLLPQTTFYGATKKAAMAKSQIAIQLVRQGVKRKAQYPYRAIGDAEDPALRNRRAAWRLLGRIFAWRIAAANEAGQYRDASLLAIDGLKFAADLRGGDAIDVDLGCSISDEIRVAALPGINRMTVSQIWNQVVGLKSVLERTPALEIAARNESLNQAVSIGRLAKFVKDEEWSSVEAVFGADGAAVAKYLRENRANGKTTAYFVELERERVSRAEEEIKNATQPTRDRTRADRNEKRVWRRAAAHYLGSWRPMLARHDRTLARTRLWIINLMLERARLLDQDPPATVEKFSESVRLDPFSGESLGYIFDGRFSRVYSIGEDLVDNGGETDQAGLVPDLTLEPIFGIGFRDHFSMIRLRSSWRARRVARL